MIERGPFRLEDALNIVIQMADGLQKPHEKGIVHRDIKPANVMVAHDGLCRDADGAALEPLLLDGDAALPPTSLLQVHLALARAYAGLGLKEEALKQTGLAIELRPVTKDALSGSEVLRKAAQVRVRIGEHDAAIDALEELLSPPSGATVNLLKVDPIWDPVRDHPRFKRLLEKYSTTGA